MLLTRNRKGKWPTKDLKLYKVHSLCRVNEPCEKGREEKPSETRVADRDLSHAQT